MSEETYERDHGGWHAHLQAAKSGNHESRDAFLERVSERSRRIAQGILGNSHDAEDVAQDAVLKINAGMHRISGTGDAEVKGYVDKTATNLARDFIRQRRIAALCFEPEVLEELAHETPVAGAGDVFSLS